MRLTKLFTEFFESEKAGGISLIICTLVSLLLANSALHQSYLQLWHQSIGMLSLEGWINDGLMAIFFLLIGLELEREIYKGELSQFKNAVLPIFAATGGMLVPVVLFLFFNYGKPSQSGAGISMATDIAFAIGILSLLGKKVPASLKVLLTAIAVIDDLGAIIVIALFYSGSFNLVNLLISLGVFGLLIVLNRLKVNNLVPYIIGGIIMWYFMLHSGVHATITGVLLAFAIPFGDGGKKSASYIIQHWLHKPVAFLVLPLFALTNTAILMDTGWYKSFTQPGSIGIMAGLMAGKPAGVLLFSFIAIVSGICVLPEGLKWKHVIGIALLAGIGFTVSIFISLLAYNDPLMITQSKIAILTASVISGVMGFFWLRYSLKDN